LSSNLENLNIAFFSLETYSQGASFASFSSRAAVASPQATVASGETAVPEATTSGGSGSQVAESTTSSGQTPMEEKSMSMNGVEEEMEVGEQVGADKTIADKKRKRVQSSSLLFLGLEIESYSRKSSID